MENFPIYNLSVTSTFQNFWSIQHTYIYTYTHTYIHKEEKYRSGSKKALLKKSHAHAYNVILVHTYTREENTQSP